jgi:hypothetical protein
VQQQLHNAFLIFKEWASRNRIICSQATFTINNTGVRPFQNKGVYPWFASKGYNTRVVAAWLAEASVAAAAGQEALKRVAGLLYMLNAYFCLSEAAGRYPADLQAERISQALLKFLFLYSKLSADAVAARKFLWPMIPKFHATVHLARDVAAEKYNARYYHTFVDEDWMGQLKRQNLKMTLKSIFCL